ncbi:penicillin-binding protein activator [Oceanicaulis sp. LC35]|uniref:penicillin-binding protein activator n=1 Tax=Oceanicaulis sp. LC35 TaxID=3349635 RepID=UPI003F837B2B
MVEKTTSAAGMARVLAGIAALGGAMALSACTASTPSAPIQTLPDRPVVGAPPAPATLAVELADRGYTPAFLEGEPDLVRVALLLPFSASSAAARNEAAQLLRAAELAVFERAGSNLVLLPKDTGGTPETARRAAESAISDGAELIIGPLFQQAVAAAGDVARDAGIPLLSLSSSSAVAGEGVYQLSFPPDEEVRRVTEYVGAMGATRFAFIGPASAYGQVTQAAYAQTIEDMLGEFPMSESVSVWQSAGEGAEPYQVDRTFNTGLVTSQFYDGGVSAMTEAAARLASYGVEELDPAQAATMSGANWTPSPGSPFQVVLLPEGGDQLRMLAPVLLYQDIDPLLVKFIGTGQWLDNSLVREPALSNGWFAGPDPEARSRFEEVYARYYGAEPSRLAGLGYDAASLAALLADGGYGPDRLGAPDGFMGVDGLFRFRADGTIERGLAVYTIRGGGFRVLDPAPQRFGPPELGDDVDLGAPVNEPAF